MNLQTKVDEFCDDWLQGPSTGIDLKDNLMWLLQSVRDTAYAAGRSEALEEAAEIASNCECDHIEDDCPGCCGARLEEEILKEAWRSVVPTKEGGR